MRRVFITGVAVLGSHLAKRCIAGWTVSGNDNFLGSDHSNLFPFVNFMEIDCCDLDKMVVHSKMSTCYFIVPRLRRAFCILPNFHNQEQL